MAYVTVENKKRVTRLLIWPLVLLFLLIIRLFYIQIVKGDYYESEAYNQQTKDRTVDAQRGTIYDSNSNKLALSVSTNKLSVAPTNLDDETKKKIAKDLSEIIDMKEDEILSKISKKTSLVIIKSDIDKDTATKVSKYILDNELKGVYLDESSTRVYPYGSFLSQVLGFVGTDNQGLSGLEIKYDEELSGVNGKIVGSVDSGGNETPYDQEEYIEPIDGYDLVLTIDANIQSIVEKNLEKAVKENVADYGICVVLNPKTGAVVSMATYPEFDPNTPFVINDEELKAKWDTIETSEKSKLLNEMWRNKAISDTHEPGSTFKVVTASAGLEEDVVEMDTQGVFNCNGYYTVSGWKIRCWRYPRTHGSQSLRMAIMNSCNPSFMQLGLKIGKERYIKYLEGFNLYGKTGIDLPGEVAGLMHEKNSMTELDLATTSFGQTVQISALQSAVIYSAIANGGDIIVPYVVSKVKTKNGETVKETTTTVKKQVISEETAELILSALYDNVETGTGKAAKVSGYKVAGKTGTGEQGRGSKLWYMASFAGIAPVNDPELVVIFNLYNPHGPAGHQGGAICAPVVGNIMDETLRYLDVNPSYTIENNAVKETLVPNLIGKKISVARTELKEKGFNIGTDTNLSEDTIIQDQVPKEGASLMSGATIRVYKDKDNKATATVPDVRGLNLNLVKNKLKNSGLNMRVVGTGNAIIQDPSPGEVVPKGSIVTVKFVDTTDIH